MERHSVSRLIGAPPGYVGYEEGGQLTEAVRRRPYSVVLLDEVEKAHPEVFNILLQVLDDGRLTDNKGRTVNFRNTILIMTSNIGAPLIMERTRHITDENRAAVHAELKEEIMKLLRQTLRPEFLNRIDEIILFQPLSRADIRNIVELQFRQVQKLLAAHGLNAKLTPAAAEYLADRGYEPAFGARPLKRVIQREIINPLSAKILEGAFAHGDTVVIDCNEKTLDFRVENR